MNENNNIINYIKDINNKINMLNSKIDILNNKIDIVIEFINNYSRGRERGDIGFLEKTDVGCGYVDNSKDGSKINSDDLPATNLPTDNQNAVIKHFRPVRIENKDIYLGSGSVIFKDIELVNGKGNVCEDQIEHWKNIYKAIDVNLEIKKAIEWLKANPTKNKTVRGFYKYINGWLMRANDRNYYKNKDNNKINNSLPDSNDSWDAQLNSRGVL